MTGNVTFTLVLHYNCNKPCGLFVIQQNSSIIPEILPMNLHKILFKWVLTILFFIPFLSKAQSNNAPKSLPDSSHNNFALKVFLDCGYCDMDYLRTELTYIDYVRDRMEAQVDIVVSSLQTGSRGTEYTFVFLGQREFRGQNDTLRYDVTSFSTDDITRKGLVQTVKLGLIRYIAKTAYASKMCISCPIDTNIKAQPLQLKDKWRGWVFTCGGLGNFNGQQLTGTANINGILQATKVTEDWKVSMGVNIGYNYGYYTITTDSTIRSVSQSANFNCLYVKSINEHFSWGINASYNNSTFNNILTQERVEPGIEYSIFPYSQATHKVFRLLYYVFGENTQYYDTTIYGKVHTMYLGQELLASINYKEPWGSLFLSLDGSNYFYDFSKNNLTFSAGFSLNLFEGFTVAFGGYASLVNNEIFLPAAGATEAEILLSTKALPTPYQYSAFVGIKYSFGSIYNNIVNPRFSPNGYNVNFGF